MDKRNLSESDIWDLFITPAIQAAGWDPFTQVRRDETWRAEGIVSDASG